MTEEVKPNFTFNPPETPEEPEIYSVNNETGEHVYNRRQFIEASAVVAAGVVLTSCDLPLPGLAAVPTPTLPPEQTEEVWPSPTAVPTSTNTPTPVPTNTPVPTDTETPTATLIPIDGRTLPGSIFLRSGPGTYYPPVTRLTTVTHFYVIGRTTDNSWVHVRLDNNIVGWLYAVLTNLPAIVDGKILAQIPVEEAPPTPTPLPGKEGKTAPGTEGIDYSYKDEFGNSYTYTLPCGSEIPAGAICTCNCVTACACDGYQAPTLCPCDTHTGCSCDSHSGSGGKKGGCSCDSVHYWYPN